MPITGADIIFIFTGLCVTILTAAFAIRDAILKAGRREE
jgi:hypothetical protein